MRIKILTEIGGVVVLVCLVSWATLYGLITLIGNAQTIADIGKPNSVLVKFLLLAASSPQWLPPTALISFCFFYVTARVYMDSRLIDEVRLANELLGTVKAASQSEGRNTDANALAILFNETADYVADQNSGLRTRTINVGVKNVGNGWLTNCALDVVSIVPAPKVESPVEALQGGFDLLKGMDRLIPLAQFNLAESLASGPATPRIVNVGIFFSVPGGWNGGAWTELSPETSYTVRLRARASGSVPCMKDIRVWVDPGRVLRASLVA